MSEFRSEATDGLKLGSTDTTLRGAARSLAPKPAPVGAVVVGGDYQGLGVVRSLGRHGIPVYVIDDEPSISRYSRYATKSFRVPELRVSARIVETVMDIGRRFGLDGWVLYPTRDEIVAAFAQHKQELSKIFRVPTPGWESVRPAWDKRLTYELAARLGIPAPETHVVSDLAELRSLDLRLPVALKPAIKEHFIYVTKVKALRADTAAELDAVFRQTCNVIPVEEVMVQELIPGDGECQFSYCGFFKEGKPLAKMLVRRARQRPAVFGRSSTYVETVDMPELEEPSERFLEAIGYYGLAEMEYKFDQRDGRYKILDVNLRTWGSHTIGWPAGVDFAYLLFRDQLGQPVDPVRAKAGVRWIRLATDLPTSLGQISRGRLSWRVFLKSLVSFDIEAVFARDDPRPGLAEITLLPHLIRTRSTRGWKGPSG